MNKVYYFANYNSQSIDGGSSRDNAFYEFLSKHKSVMIINVMSRGIFGKILKIISCVRILFFLNNKIILIHQNSLLNLFSGRMLEYKLYRNAVFRLLHKVALSNRLILEVNDLRYEQAIDLQLPLMAGYELIQHKMFSLPNVEFIFASFKMCDYAIQQFSLAIKNTLVIVNGAPQLDTSRPILTIEIKPNQINYVYAGSLNRGRQLTELIQLFCMNTGVNLYLLGTNGDWIKDYNLSPNIYYLGSLSECDAHALVATCDIGLVPYDDTRFYYNLCYPTKASFYITAGIPFLCTDLNELKLNFKESGAALFYSLSQWVEVIDSLSKEKIDELKLKAVNIQQKYLWSNLLLPLRKLLNISDDILK